MKKTTLKDLADIQVGYQARGRILELSSGEFRLIQGRDFDDQRQLHVESLASFKPERKPEPYMVREGDILFQARGTENFAAYIESRLEKTLASGSFYIVRVKSEQRILPQYLAWWLNQRHPQNFFKAEASGTWMSFISKSVLSRVGLPVPDLDTQKKIRETIALWGKERQLSSRLAELRGQLVESVTCKAVGQPRRPTQ